MNLPITNEEAKLIAYALERQFHARADQAERALSTQPLWDYIRDIAESNRREAETYLRLARMFHKLSTPPEIAEAGEVLR
jgi:hypothetical protein